MADNTVKYFGIKTSEKFKNICSIDSLTREGEHHYSNKENENRTLLSNRQNFSSTLHKHKTSLATKCNLKIYGSKTTTYGKRTFISMTFNNGMRVKKKDVKCMFSNTT